MHEVSLVSAAIAQAVAAAQRAGASRVERLTFGLDPRSHVRRETVETLVAVLVGGTLVEGAEVDFESRADDVGGPALVLTSIDVKIL
jgi:Zn finger protein HypA/HybF involved in hydrogenase expression